MNKIAKELREFQNMLGRPPDFPDAMTLPDEAANYIERLERRLRYLYNEQMGALVRPCMTFEEWLKALDEELEAE